MEARADGNDDSVKSSPKKVLNDKEIISLSITFLLAGYETTSNCFGYTAYLLATNPDKQYKLCQFVEDYYLENEVCLTRDSYL